MSLDIYLTQIRPNDRDIDSYQVSDLISIHIRTVDMVSDWLIANLGTVR